MKTIKLLLAFFALSFCSAPALLAQDAPAPEAKKAGCCAKAEKDGQACTHACCAAAAKDGKNCEKCGGKNQKKA